MIYSFQQITAIRDFLQKKQAELGMAFKYKLVKQLNHATSIYIYDENGQFKLDIDELKVPTPIGASNPTGDIPIDDARIFPPIDVRYVTQEDYDEDKAYYDDFFGGSSTFEGVTRRLDNVFGKYPPIKDAALPPIVSFYSYKGGVGRTTVLAALASYHARRTGAKVLILDCDFEAPGLINFFGMNEDDLAAKGGIVEYLTDVSYLQDKQHIDIRQYIHTVSAGASKDPLGYAGDKGVIYVMNAGNVSINTIAPEEQAPADLRSHQDHYLHGLARLDFSNPDQIVKQFQEMLLQAKDAYSPDVILIDSRTGFNDIFHNIALRLSDIVVGLFGTSKQNIPGLYNFLDTISLEDKHVETAIEVVLANSIASNVRQSFKNFKKQLEQYNQDTGNELSPEVFAIEYIPRMAEIGTPTDEGDILLDYTDPNRYAFPDYQNGKGARLLEYISDRIEKKKPTDNTPNNESGNNLTVVAQGNDVPQLIEAKEILEPLSAFFTEQNSSYAENFGQDRSAFLGKYYYFRNYLKDIFLRETFIVRGYKGTGKTLLYHALEDVDFVEKLKKFSNITEDYRFVNIVDPSNILHLNSLNFNPQNAGDKIDNYYRRFWVVYIWNALVKNFSDIYQPALPHFEVLSSETTRMEFEKLMKQDKILEVEHDLKQLNAVLVKKGIKVVISFDYLDKIVDASAWNKDVNPVAQLIRFGQFNSFPALFPKIFVRTDLFHKTQGINNVSALENKVLSLDWTPDELFGYFFKVVYQTTSETFIQWLRAKNTDKQPDISFIQQLFVQNDAQIPLEQGEMLAFLVKNFFGEYINERIPNFGKSYEWFYNNLKNADEVISLRPFIALLEHGLKTSIHTSYNGTVLLPSKYFAAPAARESAAAAYLKDIWTDYPDALRRVLETFHKPNDRLNKYRYHSIAEGDLKELIRITFQLENEPEPSEAGVLEIVKMLQGAGIIRYNLAHKKYAYSFPLLYKYYLGLKGNPQKV